MSQNGSNPQKSKFYSKGASRGTNIGAVTTAARAGQQQVTAYLASNPEFLESYVLNNVDLDTLERWTIRKARKNNKGGKC